MDRGAWLARVHGVTKSQTQLKRLSSSSSSSSVFLPRESYGERSLEGYSPWGCKELDMTEVTEHACRLLCGYSEWRFNKSRTLRLKVGTRGQHRY